jgi:hypothetical protein
MFVPAEETTRYNQFAVQLATKLKSVDIPPETILWHYTTGSSLISIISSGTMFATQVSCLNDSTEIRYSSKLLQNALTNLRGSVLSDVVKMEFIDRALENMKEDPDYPAQSGLPYFVSCFSLLEDDLSQWRAYGGGENGYAIGFRAGDLRSTPILLIRVNYDPDLHRQLAEEAAEATLRFFIEGLVKYGQNDRGEWSKVFLPVWDAALTQVAPFVKDPGFSSECECRIVKGFLPADLKSLHFTQKNSLMSRHLPLRLGSEDLTSTSKLPIARILVGPSRHRHVSRISVDTLMRQKGYPTGLVSISASPFQLT